MRAVASSFPGPIVRRFCACGLVNRCHCGLPQRLTRWSVERLTELRGLMREHGSAAIAAEVLGETVHECNLALDTLLGRTPVHALAVIEAKADKKWRTSRNILAATR